MSFLLEKCEDTFRTTPVLVKLTTYVVAGQLLLSYLQRVMLDLTWCTLSQVILVASKHTRQTYVIKVCSQFDSDFSLTLLEY